MNPLLTAVVLAGMCFGDDKPAAPPLEPCNVTPDKDVRLACLADAKPQKIGVLTYYPNKGGGYTFMEVERIAFYSLPYMPTDYPSDRTVQVIENRNGNLVSRRIVERTTLASIGTATMPFGGQSIYRGEMMQMATGVFRKDTALATWSRDTPDGHFRLFIMDGNRETRLKLKSIVPVLEHASK
jgi:hypothetical protein